MFIKLYICRAGLSHNIFAIFVSMTKKKSKGVEKAAEPKQAAAPTKVEKATPNDNPKPLERIVKENGAALKNQMSEMFLLEEAMIQTMSRDGKTHGHKVIRVPGGFLFDGAFVPKQ